jgi:DNA-binding MarR family transcriptional regulator
MSEPIDDLDDVVHQRMRLGILTICHEARRVEFSFLQEALVLTAGNLSRHLQVLEAADLVHIEKTYEARRPKTWISITKTGVASLEREISALREIVTRVEAASAMRDDAAEVTASKRRPARGPSSLRVRPSTP